MGSSQGLRITVVSGKGGVGKTMLAVALARELSTNVRTLVVDLDFFNRGLTGLMRHGRVIQRIKPPEFFTDPLSPEPDAPWELVEVAPNLLHIRYPDFTPEQIQVLENTEITLLKQALERFLKSVEESAECEAIVVDCHGGPDQLSFAACLVADYSLLVSEPDKITFYGTLHFLRQLRRVIPKNSEHRSPDVRLVFNKVVPAFSAVYLRGFYDKEIRSLFDDRPLLAVFPMEMYLTKEFERTPFLTAVYPFSLLAKKTRVLLRDLLQESHPRFVPKSVRSASRLRLFLIRHSVGRTPWIVDLNQVMAVIAVGVVLAVPFGYYGHVETQKTWAYGQAVTGLELFQYAQQHPEAVPQECVGLPLWQGRLSCWQRHRHQDVKGGPSISDFYGNEEVMKIERNSSDLRNRAQLLLDNAELRSSTDSSVQESYKTLQISWYDDALARSYEAVQTAGLPLALVAGIWFLIALLTLWSSELDRAFTYFARVTQRGRALFTFLLAAGLWFLPLLLFTYGLNESAKAVRSKSTYPIPLENRLLTKATLALVTASLIVCMGVVLQQWFKGYQNFRYERRPVESFARLAFGCYLITTPVVLLLKHLI